MKLFFRLFWLIFTQAKRSRVTAFGPAVTDLRVFPNDLDLFFHVNNGVYFTYADLARTDLLLRANLFHKIRKNGWYPVVAAETIRFKKSLKLWQKFSIKTEVIGWSEKAFYIQQTFSRNEKTVATALIDARFLSIRGEKITSLEFCEFIGIESQSPELPASVRQWIESNQSA